MNRLCLAAFWRLLLVPLLLALLTVAMTPRAGRAQGAPPPPPAEGLDPKTAPATSTEPETGDGSPAAHAAAPAENALPDVAPDAASTSPAAVFRLDFMQRSLIAGLIVSGICGFVGVYVVLRRIVFVGVALAEMSSAGVALALLAGFSPMLGSVLVMLAGVGLVSVRWGGRKVRQDAFIGIGYAVASALAVLLIAKSPRGEGDLLDVLFGNILTVTTRDVATTALALGLVLLFHLLFFKELLFVSFDPDTAAASGYNARLWEALLYVSIGLTIAFAIHTVGVLLTFAALVIPAVSALLVTRRMGRALATAVAAGLLPVPIGLYLSFVWDLPSAATIVAVSFVLLLLAGAVSKLRAA